MKSAGALTMIPSNRIERETVIEMLSTISVLENPDYPGFRLRFIPESQRVVPGDTRSERGYPADWWRSHYRVNWDAVDEYWPDLASRS